MAVKIIDSWWFNTIGIVKTYNGFETKWYIGNGIGLDQSEDEKQIATFGQPFYPQLMREDASFFRAWEEPNLNRSVEPKEN
jgi:hypothetical protein